MNSFERARNNIKAYHRNLPEKKIEEMTVFQLINYTHPTDRVSIAQSFYNEGYIKLIDLKRYEKEYKKWQKDSKQGI